MLMGLIFWRNVLIKGGIKPRGNLFVWQVWYPTDICLEGSDNQRKFVQSCLILPQICIGSLDRWSWRLWTPANIPSRQSDWSDVAVHVQCLYISWYVTVNKPVLSYLSLCLLPHVIIICSSWCRRKTGGGSTYSYMPTSLYTYTFILMRIKQIRIRFEQL
jgi:hypothetical protein